jgi:hypothetical protein
MPVNKDGNKYRARFTHNGVRIDLKRFDTEAEAELAIGLKKQELARVSTYTVRNFRLDYEKTGALRRLVNRLARK